MRAIALGVILLLGGCASVQPVTVKMHVPEHKLERNYQVGAEQSVYVGQPMVRVKDYYVQQTDVQVLRPNQTFQFKLPPFGLGVDVPQDTALPVVGTTSRDGKTFRLVRLPASTGIQGFQFLVTEDGAFEGSVIGLMSGRMGYTYKPTPATVRLLPDQSQQVVTARGFTNFELVYGGMNGDSMQVMYREYTPDDMARPAFTQQLVYALASKMIRFRDVQIAVTSADNEKIIYTVLADTAP